MRKSTTQAVPFRSSPSGAPPLGAGFGRKLERLGVDLVREISALLLPVACPGCGEHDVVICRACLSLFAQGMQRRESGAPKLMRLNQGPVLPVWSLTEYLAAPRQIILAWKNHGRLDLSPLLATLLAVAAEELMPLVAAAGATDQDAPMGQQLVVVPMPSSAANRRRRGGRQPVLELAHGVTAGLQSAGINAVVADALVQRRGVRDQVGLSRRQRQQNLQRALALRNGTTLGSHQLVLLVDDILTTGSTLAAADQVLRRNGAFPFGAITLAATPASPDGTFGLPDMPGSG